MKNTFKYCVVIRTLGTGGQKYRSLLNSIDNQTIKPIRVFVFIAEGYPLPKEQLGYEEFVYTKKGMWHQRVFGMQYVAKQEPDSVQLVLDDDLSFEDDFVERLYDLMLEHNADVLVPGAGQYGNVLRNIYFGLLAQRFETKSSEYRIKITPSAGYIVNTSKNNVMPTQSGQFAVFMIKSSCIESLKLQDEYWLEETKYALPDDQVFFYKCHCCGYTIMNCIKPSYFHLDHGGLSPDRAVNFAYANGRNFIIFWHRFLYLPATSFKHRFILLTSIVYRIIANLILLFINSIKNFNAQIIIKYIQGVKHGLCYISSKKYKILNSIVDNSKKECVMK